MSSTTFTDQATIIAASWLNDANTVVYTYFGNGTSLNSPSRLTIAEVRSTGAVRASGSSIAGTPSTAILDWAGVSGRIIAYGADTSTIGQFAIHVAKSDGATDIIGLSVGTTGAVTFPVSVVAGFVTAGAGSNLITRAPATGGLVLGANGTDYWQIYDGTTAGLLYPLLDNTYSIGKAANRAAAVFTPIIDSGTTGSLFFKTNNGTDQLRVLNVTSAVNRIEIFGATTGNAPTIQANGSDANPQMNLNTAGTGAFNFNTNVGGSGVTQFQVLHTASSNRNITVTGSNGGQPILGATSSAGVAIVGTATSDNAQAGQYGEMLTTNLGSGSAITLTTNTPANVISLTLTPGDWDVTGTLSFLFGATTSYTNLIGNWSITTATLSGILGSYFDYETAATVPTAGSDQAWVMPVTRFAVSVSTTVFLVTQATFTVSTLKAYGAMRARRMR